MHGSGSKAVVLTTGQRCPVHFDSCMHKIKSGKSLLTFRKSQLGGTLHICTNRLPNLRSTIFTLVSHCVVNRKRHHRDAVLIVSIGSHQKRHRLQQNMPVAILIRALAGALSLFNCDDECVDKTVTIDQNRKL